MPLPQVMLFDQLPPRLYAYLQDSQQLDSVFGMERDSKRYVLTLLDSTLTYDISTGDASEGMRQSPRGDRHTLPTFGPSGMQERLNYFASEADSEAVRKPLLDIIDTPISPELIPARALARLAVLVSHIVDRGVVPYVGKMLLHSLHYRSDKSRTDSGSSRRHNKAEDRRPCGALRVARFLPVLHCAPRCAESGHSNAQNTFPVKAEAVEGPHSHKKSQGRIQSPRWSLRSAGPRTTATRCRCMA